MATMTTEERIDQVRERVAAMGAVERHAGYRLLFNQWVNVRATKLLEVVQAPSSSFPETARTFVAGELRSLEFCMNLLQQMVTGDVAVLRLLEQKLEAQSEPDSSEFEDTQEDL